MELKLSDGGTVWNMMCESFHEMWSADQIRHQLDDASHAVSAELSSLSLTDAVSQSFYTLFENYITWKVESLNAGIPLPQLVDEFIRCDHDGSSIISLFHEAMNSISPPPLNELSRMNGSRLLVYNHINNPFPFFSKIGSYVEDIISARMEVEVDGEHSTLNDILACGAVVRDSNSKEVFRSILEIVEQQVRK